MKFEVELKDFELEYEEELIPALRSYVVTEVSANIWKVMEEHIKVKIQEEATRAIEYLMSEKLPEFIDSEIERGIVRESRYSNKEVKIEDWVKAQFNETMTRDLGDRLTRAVKDKAKSLSDEIKNRYDLLFASQIVAKMSDHGFLKEDVANLILPEKKS